MDKDEDKEKEKCEENGNQKLEIKDFNKFLLLKKRFFKQIKINFIKIKKDIKIKNK